MKSMKALASHIVDGVWDAATAAFQVGCESPPNSVGRTAAEQVLAEEEALKKGMAEKSREFTGSELYAKA